MPARSSSVGQLRWAGREKLLTAEYAESNENAEKNEFAGGWRRLRPDVDPALCRAFVSLGGLVSADRVRIFGRGKKDETVVAKFALAASDKLEKEQSAGSIQPGERFPVGTVNFVVAAVRAAFPTDLQRAKRSHFRLKA